MRISDLNEAINPKGPEKIPTGGRGSIANPAHSPSAYYEGDPAKFDFKAQKRNYEAIKAALARSGKKLNYIGVARSASGPDTFVATGPGVVWQKYVPNDPQGSMNMIYINGVKLKVSSFVSSSPAEQDTVLGGKKSDAILLQKKDLSGYVKALVKEANKAGIEESFEKNQKEIIGLIYDSVAYQPEILKTVEECENLLASMGVKIPWFTKEEMIKKSTPKIAKHLAVDLCHQTARIQDQIDKFAQYGFDLDIDKVLMTEKDFIIKTLLVIMKTDRAYEENDYTFILSTIMDLRKLVDWTELDTMKSSIVASLTSKKEVVIRNLLKRIKESIDIRDSYYLNDISRKVNVLKQAVDWPELDAMQRSLSAMKRSLPNM